MVWKIIPTHPTIIAVVVICSVHTINPVPKVYASIPIHLHIIPEPVVGARFIQIVIQIIVANVDTRVVMVIIAMTAHALRLLKITGHSAMALKSIHTVMMPIAVDVAMSVAPMRNVSMGNVTITHTTILR